MSKTMLKDLNKSLKLLEKVRDSLLYGTKMPSCKSSIDGHSVVLWIKPGQYKEARLQLIRLKIELLKLNIKELKGELNEKR